MSHLNSDLSGPSISASALESFLPSLGGCERFWAWQRLDGIARPEGAPARFGSLAHRVAEDYLRDGVEPDLGTPEGRAVAAAKPYLPSPGVAEVERAFRFRYRGVIFSGRIDYEYFDQSEDRDTYVIGDHKFTGDLRYAKTVPGDDSRPRATPLLEHPQAPLYALSVFDRPDRPDRVRLEWSYVYHGLRFPKLENGEYSGEWIPERRPKALVPPVRWVLSREHAVADFEPFVEPARRMLTLIESHGRREFGVDAPAALSLPPSPETCGARKFGPSGCPYRSRCNLRPEELAAAAFGRYAAAPYDPAADPGILLGYANTLEETLTASLEKPSKGVVMAQEKPSENRPKNPVPSTDPFAFLLGETALPAPPPVPAVPVPTPPADPFAAAGDLFKQAFAASPPAFGPGPAPSAPGAFGPVNPPESTAVVVPAPPASPEEPPTRPDAPAPKRRGRPPGSKNRSRDAAPPADAATPAVVPVPALALTHSLPEALALLVKQYHAEFLAARGFVEDEIAAAKTAIVRDLYRLLTGKEPELQ